MIMAGVRRLISISRENILQNPFVLQILTHADIVRISQYEARIVLASSNPIRTLLSTLSKLGIRTQEWIEKVTTIRLIGKSMKYFL